MTPDDIRTAYNCIMEGRVSAQNGATLIGGIEKATGLSFRNTRDFKEKMEKYFKEQEGRT